MPYLPGLLSSGELAGGLSASDVRETLEIDQRLPVVPIDGQDNSGVFSQLSR